MKTNLLAYLITAAFCVTAFPVAGLTVQVAPSPGLTSPAWTAIDDCTYTTRAQFFAGLSQLEATVDRQVGELTAKHAAMKPMAKAIDYTQWDLAMKEMQNARSYLQATANELRKATPETWNQEKDKVAQAWVRTQDACEGVILSTAD
jgi:hypothetical protein